MVGCKELVVVGNGMVGHRFLQSMIDGKFARQWRLTAFGDEPRFAYDRVNLSTYFDGKRAEELSLVAPGGYEAAGAVVYTGDAAVAIDRATADRALRERPRGRLRQAGAGDGLVSVRAADRRQRDSTGCFVYRTIEDLEAIRAYAAGARSAASSSAAACSGSRRPTRSGICGSRDPRRRVRAAPDDAAGRRDRRRPAARRASRSSASRCTRRRRPPRSCATASAWPGCASPTAASSTPTWWSSPPASARATSSPAPPGSPSASAAAS